MILLLGCSYYSLQYHMVAAFYPKIIYAKFVISMLLYVFFFLFTSIHVSYKYYLYKCREPFPESWTILLTVFEMSFDFCEFTVRQHFKLTLSPNSSLSKLFSF